MSLKLRINDSNLTLRNILEPYSDRLQTLSLESPLVSLSTFLSGPPIPFFCLNTLVLIPTQHQPASLPAENMSFPVFTASPRLRNMTLIGRSLESIGYPILSQLPWPQLTYLSLRMYRPCFSDLERTLRQCTKLVSLSFTSPSRHFKDPTFTDSSPKIFLPTVQSLTLISDGSQLAFDTLEFLRVPSMTECTVEHVHPQNPLCYVSWKERDFINMLSRSGCTLRSLNLLTMLRTVSFESLLPQLPHLVKLVVWTSNPIPGSIFDSMIRGEILGKLEHLECFTPSPMSFLRFLECQHEFETSGNYRGLHSANVSYNTPNTREELRELREMYNRLRPKLENGEKAITLNKI